MHRLSAIDDPVELNSLVDSEDLAALVDDAARLHGARVAVRDFGGDELASAGAAEGPEAVTPLIYNGEILGDVVVSGPDAERGEAICQSLSRTLGAVIHAGYARHLTSTVHVAAISEAFGELSDKNKRLASASVKLEEVDRLKANFLATISHELRTPLTSVIGYSEMLIEGLAGALNAEQRDYVETILGKADQLLQLITGILDVSLIESKSLRLTRKPVSLLELIDGVATTLSREAEKRSIVVELPVEAVPRVMGDSRKLRQVVLHLLANAIKFSPNGTDVKVNLSIGPLSPGDHSTFGSPTWVGDLSDRFGVRMTVADSGIGIPKDKTDQIFEPFFQVDSGSTREFGGTGLGLSLARSYVEAHGGFIWVDSHPGTGSVFTVSLPAVPGELQKFLTDQTASTG